MQERERCVLICTMMRRALIVFTVLLLSSITQAADLNAMEKDLQDQFLKKTLTMKYFYKDDRLHFSHDGELRGKSDTGPWTLFGNIMVQKIHLIQDSLVIEGDRIAVGFQADKRLNFVEPSYLKISIDLPAPVETGSITTAMSKVFLNGNDDIADFMPDFWLFYFKKAALKQTPDKVAVEAKTSSPHLHISSGVARGNLKKQVPIFYPDLGKSWRQAGSVVLQGTIGKDGRMIHLRVVRPAGMGLDEAAYESVKQWEYNPYRFKGEPVAVETTITVNFSIGKSNSGLVLGSPFYREPQIPRAQDPAWEDRQLGPR